MSNLGKKYKKQYNEIINDHGEWLEVDVSTKTHPDSILKIDKEDYYNIVTMPNMGRLTIVWSKNANYPYVQVAETIDGKQKQFLLHKLIKPEYKMINHINLCGVETGLDNRKCNLESTTPSKNSMKSHQFIKTKSGHRGIVAEKSGNFRVTFQYQKKRLGLGTYKTLEEALKVRKDAEIKYFD